MSEMSASVEPRIKPLIYFSLFSAIWEIIQKAHEWSRLYRAPDTDFLLHDLLRSNTGVTPWVTSPGDTNPIDAAGESP